MAVERSCRHDRVQKAAGFWTASAEIFLKPVLSDDDLLISRMIHGGFKTKDEAEGRCVRVGNN